MPVGYKMRQVRTERFARISSHREAPFLKKTQSPQYDFIIRVIILYQGQPRMGLYIYYSSFYLMILILVCTKLASIYIHLHIDLVLELGLICTLQQNIIQVVTEPTSIQQAYFGTTSSPEKCNTRPNSAANGIGACSASPVAAFRAGPTSTGGCSKCSIAGHTTLNHIKKPALLLTIKSLGGCSVTTPTSWPLFLPGWPLVFSNMIQPDLVGKMNPKFSKISQYDCATRIGDVFTTTQLHADELFNLPK